MLFFVLFDMLVLLVLLNKFTEEDSDDQKRKAFFAALFISILGSIAFPALLDQLGILSRSAKGVYVAISLIGLWPLVYVAIGIIVFWTLASISLEQASRVMAFFLVYRVAVGLALTVFALTIARVH